MKILNIYALTLAIAYLTSFGLITIANKYFGETGKYAVLPLVFLIGFNARRIVEKLVGYTLKEAIDESIKKHES